jgi:drug/metabolite transporter (DMT)-like permease
VIMGALGVGMGERFSVWPSPSVWLAFGYLVIFGSIVAYSACLYLLRMTPAPVATSYAYVNPLLGAALGALTVGERLSPEVIVSGLLVVLGVATLLSGAAPKRA